MIYEIESPNSSCNERGSITNESWSGGNLVWTLSSGTKLSLYGDSMMSISASKQECSIGRSRINESYGGGRLVWMFPNGTRFKSRSTTLSDIEEAIAKTENHTLISD